MTRALVRSLAVSVTLFAFAPLAAAQDAPSVLDRIFGARERTPEATQQVAQQADAAELIVRIDRLEAQIRQLTGTIEQLQYRNQQLEAQVKQMEATGQPSTAVPHATAMPPNGTPPYGAPPRGTPPHATARPQPMPAPTVAAPAPAPLPAPAPPGRHSDVFDPNQNPNAPGAPKTLGTLPGPRAELPPEPVPTPPVGVPDGRTPGEPLDLSTLATGVPSAAPPPTAAPAPTGPAALPAPPPRVLSSTGTAVAPPSETAQGYFDLAYGYVQRKDYVFAEEAFKTFLKKYPNDALVPDAQFWLGEVLYQRQRYDNAAEQFLAAATKHPGYAKAPDALLRLAQSLAAINQKEMACATLAEVGRKYPRAATSIRQSVEREQKRVRC